MDAKASKRLKVGQRVVFTQDNVLGTVIGQGHAGVGIAWADGMVGIIDHNDMQDVSRHLGFEMSGHCEAAPSNPADRAAVARDIRPSVLKRWVSDTEHIGYDIVDIAQTLKPPMGPAKRVVEAGFVLQQLLQAGEELAELIFEMETVLRAPVEETVPQ